MDGDESADEGSWSAVEGVANAAEGSMMVGFLESHDIPARVVDRSFHQTPTTDDDLSPIAVAVPTSRLEEARNALDRREKEFEASTGGAETVQTDEGPVEIDPAADRDEGDKPVG